MGEKVQTPAPLVRGDVVVLRTREGDFLGIVTGDCPQADIGCTCGMVPVLLKYCDHVSMMKPAWLQKIG